MVQQMMRLADMGCDYPAQALKRSRKRGLAFGISILMDPATGIRDKSGEVFEVFPNPACEEIYIRCASSGTVARFFSPDGKIMMELRMIRGLNTIKVREIPPGIYYIRFHSARKTIHRKLILH